MAKVLKLVNGLFRYEELTPSVYEGVFVASGTVTAGTSVTLPESATYTDEDLSIYFNGQRLNYTEDYTYVGSPPRTQVQFTFDIYDGEIVTFRRET